MSGPLPLRPSIDAMASMTSRTAQRVLAALGDGPAPASDLVDHVDTSLQNVHYHLENLREVGLVEAVGTWYSAKGTEMTVYGLTAERVEVRLADADADDAVAGTDGPEEATTVSRPDATESASHAPTGSD